MMHEYANTLPVAAKKQWASGSWASLPLARQPQAGTQDLLGLSCVGLDSGAEGFPLDLSPDSLGVGIPTLESWITTEDVTNR